jgi:hypothetical protein
MASLTITLTGTCAQHGGSGAHVTFAISGAASHSFDAEIAEVTQSLTKEDALAFAKVLVRLAKVDRTNAQLRTLLQSGVTVSV